MTTQLYHPHMVEIGQVYEIRRGLPRRWHVQAVDGDLVYLCLDLDEPWEYKVIKLATLRKDYWRVDE